MTAVEARTGAPHTIEQLYDQALECMESTVHALAARVPPPKEVLYRGQPAFRYTEKRLHQAIVQKLVRYVSGLQAARVLLEGGFVQEQCALQRMLDEFEQDITFLSYALIFDKREPLHDEYLEAFYAEEFPDDDSDIVDAPKDRPTISRKKIRAYNARCEQPTLEMTRGVKLSATISKAYSGYVHGASPHIMDMYYGDPPRFHIRGMLGTNRMPQHARDLWNYFFRGICACGVAAAAFGDAEMLDQIDTYKKGFAKRSGRNYDDEA
jgi:hypothetical protein